ncbi:MAG: L-lysine 6-transaminase [Ignavibacteria bacterium]|nr:L-lysine 6-transaminase [Ignavibacteria bacterium]
MDAKVNKLGEMLIEKSIDPFKVHEILKRNLLIDGFELVLDLDKSHGLNIVDAKTGDEYLDFYSFFASSPVGLNHPDKKTEEFRKLISSVALNKPSNSDIYTVEYARFVDTFSKYAKPENFKYLFFIEGGSLAVENALKVAFDWKVRKNFSKGYSVEKGQQIIHFKQAFHGRSGYTLSLTNTDPVKINYFPKFNWPRIINPKIKFPLPENLNELIKLENQAVDEIFEAIKNNQDDIAAIIIEPIQCEGGDNFFRKEFFVKLREIADENEILLIFDEVQTGLGITGKMWAHEHYIEPDIVAFGKKFQTCGIMVSDRIDDVDEHVFKKSSRINSTWGGNLTDMVRSRKNLEIVAEHDLIKNSEIIGDYLLNNLFELQNDFPTLVSQVRGLGLLCAFDLPNPELRKNFLKELYKRKMIMLGCGPSSVRFRPSLIITKENIDLGIQIIRESLLPFENKS